MGEYEWGVDIFICFIFKYFIIIEREEGSLRKAKAKALELNMLGAADIF